MSLSVVKVFAILFVADAIWAQFVETLFLPKLLAPTIDIEKQKQIA